MKKALIITNNLNGGGAEKVTQDVANYLADQNYRVQVAALAAIDGDTSCYHEGIQFNICLHHASGAARILYKSNQVRLIAKLMASRHDLVLVMKEGLYLKIGARVPAESKLCWFHSDLSDVHWTRHFFKSNEEERQTMAQYDHIVCVSEVVKQSIINRVGDPGNLVVRYNPIHVRELLKKAEEPTTVPMRSGVVFGVVSRLSKEKGIMRVLQCAKRLKENGYSSFSVWIIGDGEERSALEDYANQNNLSEVLFLGWKDNPYPFMKQMDYLLSASTTESYGLVVQEAHILGTPSILCRLPAFEECVVPGSALLVDQSLDGLFSGMESALKGTLNICKKQHVDGTALHEAYYSERLKDIESCFQSEGLK